MWDGGQAAGLATISSLPVVPVFPAVSVACSKNSDLVAMRMTSELAFGYPSVMRVFYKFLKNDCWNLPRKAPENQSRSGPKASPTRPPPKAPKWPLGHKRLNDEHFLRFSFGSEDMSFWRHLGHQGRTGFGGN